MRQGYFNMNTLKEILKPSKKKTQILIAIAVIGMLMHSYHLFFSLYKLQSPIVIELRSPVTSKFISPVSEDTIRVIELKPTSQAEEEATPTPTPTPVKKTLIPQVHAAEVEGDEVKEYIVEKFGKDAPIMLKIAQCESGTQAYNWYNKWLGATRETAEREGYAVGVFMIYRKVHAHLSFDDMLDYKKNIDYAHGLFLANGTAPWLSSKHCWEL